MMVSSRAVNVFESYKRFNSGEKMSEETWDYVTVPNAAAFLKSEYDLDFGGDIIPEDKDMIDRLFNAGIDMLAEVGFFNSDLGRTLSITEGEILEGIKMAPKKLRIGNGRNEVTCERRTGNCHAVPIVFGGPTGSPVSEEIFTSMMQAYAQEASIDGLVSGVMSTVNGYSPTTNTPLEIEGTLAEIRAVKEGMRRAGRPGMGI